MRESLENISNTVEVDQKIYTNKRNKKYKKREKNLVLQLQAHQVQAQKKKLIIIEKKEND